MIEPPVLIGEDAGLRKGAKAGPFTVLGSGAMLKENTRAVQTVVFPGGIIEENSRLERCIVGPGAVAVSSKPERANAELEFESFFLKGRKQPIPF